MVDVHNGSLGLDLVASTDQGHVLQKGLDIASQRFIGTTKRNRELVQ